MYSTEAAAIKAARPTLLRATMRLTSMKLKAARAMPEKRAVNQ
jgi:hypothetical protein